LSGQFRLIQHRNSDLAKQIWFPYWRISHLLSIR
jgi:hypothetical protein